MEEVALARPGIRGVEGADEGVGVLRPSKARSTHHAQWCAQGSVVPAVKKERRLLWLPAAGFAGVPWLSVSEPGDVHPISVLVVCFC